MLKPGKLLDDGRYRLVDPYGADERAGLEFWRAHDTRLRRDVALTLLAGDVRDTAAVHGARLMTAGARRSGWDYPALARVLDVLGPDDFYAADGVLCLVVAEWTEGTDLVDIVRDGPVTPLAACRLLRPLVAAADRTHHHGLVLGLESGGALRIRINGQGMATLAFPGSGPTATSRQDVRGLGALLYLLLTGASADTTSPHWVPRELSLITMLSLEDTSVGGIRTCGPLLSVIDRVIQSEHHTQPVAPVVTPPPPVASPRPPSRVEPIETRSGDLLSAEPGTTTITPVKPARTRTKMPGQRRLAVLTAVLSVGAMALAVWIGTEIAGFFHQTPQHTPVAITHPATTPDGNSPQRVLRPTTTTTDPGSPAAPTPNPLTPAAVREYLVSGSPDNPGRLSRVLDGDPNTGWPTAQYKQQFPSYLPGIGLMLAFNGPEQVSTVTIDSPSAGTVVEIRAAASPDTSLADTQLLGTATLNAGTTTIPIQHAAPTDQLLVWITKLAGGDGGYQTTISEISCLGTP